MLGENIACQLIQTTDLRIFVGTISTVIIQITQVPPLNALAISVIDKLMWFLIATQNIWFESPQHPMLFSRGTNRVCLSRTIPTCRRTGPLYSCCWSGYTFCRYFQFSCLRSLGKNTQLHLDPDGRCLNNLRCDSHKDRHLQNRQSNQCFLSNEAVVFPPA